MKGRFDKEEGFPGNSPENVTLNQQECSVYSYIAIKKNPSVIQCNKAHKQVLATWHATPYKKTINYTSLT